MRYYYAQLDMAGICVGVLETHRPIANPSMVAIATYDPTRIGLHWDGVQWGAPS